MKRIQSIITSYKRSLPRLRKAIIENSDRNLVLGKAELALIVLNGNCKNFRCGADRLRKHKNVQRRLVDKGIAIRKKKKLIVQRGGFLLPLLTAALSALLILIQL